MDRLFIITTCFLLFILFTEQSRKQDINERKYTVERIEQLKLATSLSNIQVGISREEIPIGYEKYSTLVETRIFQGSTYETYFIDCSYFIGTFFFKDDILISKKRFTKEELEKVK